MENNPVIVLAEVSYYLFTSAHSKSDSLTFPR